VHPVCGFKWRQFSVTRVLTEIEDLFNNYHVSHIEIEDDNFTLDNKRTIQILDGLIYRNKSNFPISWSAPNGIRIDTLNEEIIHKIKESNCKHINIALEHGNKDVLSLMNKKLDLEKVVTIIKLLKIYKISTGIFIIFGYPGETRERFINALELYKEIKIIKPDIGFAFFLPQPYPKTKLFMRCVKEGYLPDNYFCDISDIKLMSTDKLWIETPDFNKKEILMRKKILHKTLDTPKSIKRVIYENTPDFICSLYQFSKKLLFKTK
ncbi:MAG: radical SAM protein, partial [Bacteroidales bacterium]